jgi:glycosyltransferase involved in cell wall biosynthesis
MTAQPDRDVASTPPHRPDDGHRAIRVLWLIKGLGPGGAERLLVTLAEIRDTSQVSYEVAYLLDWKRHLVPMFEGEGVRTRCLGEGRLAALRWPWRLRRLIRAGEYDVVHSHSPMLAIVARLLVRTVRSRPATVYTEHNIWPAYGRLTRTLNAVTHAMDDRTFAVSQAVRDSIRPVRRQQQVPVLIHGINRDRLTTTRSRHEVRSELGLKDEQIAVITVANMRPQKAYPDLVAAAEQVLTTRPDLRFFAVGQGPQLEEIRALVAERGLEDRFHILGERHDVFDLLAAVEVFALSSLWEGFPIAIMEAMSSGLPCAATSVGGVPDAIENGVEGILVAPGNPGAMADAILEIVSDPPRRLAMGEAARARSVRFDIRETEAALLQTYRTLTPFRTVTAPAARGRPGPESRG